MTDAARLRALAAALGLGLALPLAGASPAHAVPLPHTQAAPPAPLTAQLTDLRPRAPQPGDTLHVAASLANPGAEPVTDLQVRLGVGSRISTRLALRQADGAPRAYTASTQTDLADLPAGASREVDVEVPVDDLALGADGVYPLQLEVRGRTSPGALRVQLTTVDTYLPWFGGRTVDPLRVAWVWPLVDVPHAGPDDVLLDDGLATSLARNGRLGRSLDASRAGESGTCPSEQRSPRCSPVRVTYAVDPALLTDVQTMTGPYQVHPRGREPVPGVGSDEAEAWLTGLRAAAGAGLVALPYADPDVVALTRGDTGLAADVGAARSYGVTVAREALGAEPLDTVAFPPPGRLTGPAFDALTTPSVRALVLQDDAVTPPAEVATYTRDTRVGLPPSATSGPVIGLLVERGLSDLLAD